MYQSVVLFIALRYIYSKKVNRLYKYISWFFSIAIMLSVAIIIIILSVMNGLERELKKNLLYFIPHVMITANEGYTHIQNIPHFLIYNIYNDILYIKPLVTSDVILQSMQGISFGIMSGINPNHFEPLFNRLQNNINQLTSGKYYAIIGSKLAQNLSVSINDQIRLTIPSVHKIILGNYFFSQRLFTILDIYNSDNEIDGDQILIHQDDAADLMHYPEHCITGWRIWLREPFNLSKFSQLHIPKNWCWKDWSESKGSLFQAIKIEKSIMFFLFILIILAITFNIVSFLILLITNKTKEVAILKTCGLRRMQIMMLFIIQGIYSSIIGILCGIVLGVLVSKNLNQILNFLNIFPKTLLIPVEIHSFQILLISWIICFIIILAIFYPAWYIASLRPAQVLYYYDQKF